MAVPLVEPVTIPRVPALTRLAAMPTVPEVFPEFNPKPKTTVCHFMLCVNTKYQTEHCTLLILLITFQNFFSLIFSTPYPLLNWLDFVLLVPLS